jgi:hypothetical protein
MGKVFVKGPVESPDDLLAKESQLGRAGRVLGDATEGAIEMTEPIDSFGSLMRKPLGALRYLAEGRYKRKLSPEEEAIQNARLRRIAQDQIREEMQPAMDAKAALAAKQKEEADNQAAKQKEEADNQALLSRFQNLSQRKGAEAAQLSGHKGATDLSEYEEYARENYPGMSLNEVANMLGQQFTNVEGLDLRRRMTGKEGIEGFGPAQQTAQGLQTASNAAEEGEAAPLPNVNVGHLIDPASNPVPELMNTLNDTESPNIPTDKMGTVAVTQVPQVTAGPPEPPAGGYANETNSDKESENAIVNNTGYDLDGEIAQLPEGTNEEPNSNQGAKRPIDFDVDAKNPMDVKQPSEPQNLADIVDEEGGNF